MAHILSRLLLDPLTRHSPEHVVVRSPSLSKPFVTARVHMVPRGDADIIVKKRKAFCIIVERRQDARKMLGGREIPQHELSPVTPTIIVTPSAPPSRRESPIRQHFPSTPTPGSSTQGRPTTSLARRPPARRRQPVHPDPHRYLPSRPAPSPPSPTSPADGMSEVMTARQMSPLAIGGWGREWERAFAHRLPATYPTGSKSDAIRGSAVVDEEEAEGDLLADLKGFPMPPVRLGLLTPPQSPEDELLPQPLDGGLFGQQVSSKNSMWRWSASESIEHGDIEEMTDEEVGEDADDDARTITASTPTSQGSRWSAPEVTENQLVISGKTEGPTPAAMLRDAYLKRGLDSVALMR